MKSSIIILTYNSSNFIENLLKSLKRFAKESEVLVVDNHSSDGTGDIAKKFDSVKVYETGENLGFAKGINYGVKKASGEYVIFINPDSVFNSGEINDLISTFDKFEKIGVVGGKILDFNGVPEKSAGKFFNLIEALAIILGLDELIGVRFSPKRVTSVDFVSGGFMMIKKSIFEEIGGLDEGYFMYLEDMDFCYRLKKAGYSTMFNPNVSISHSGQGSSNRSFAIYNIYKGLLYFYKKQKSSWEFQVVRSGLYLKAELIYLLGRITNNSYYVSAYGEALKLF